MKGTLAEFNRIVDVEQYFEFFDLPFDPHVVNVNRLHILKKFAIAIRNIDSASTATTEGDLLDEYRAALDSSYEVFLSSNALEQKLFKVFNQKPQNVVMLKDMVIVH